VAHRRATLATIAEAVERDELQAPVVTVMARRWRSAGRLESGEAKH
jgi:hypothetical protein